MVDDIAIFGFNKSLPAPDGDALVINYARGIRATDSGMTLNLFQAAKMVAVNTAY